MCLSLGCLLNLLTLVSHPQNWSKKDYFEMKFKRAPNTGSAPSLVPLSYVIFFNRHQPWNGVELERGVISFPLAYSGEGEDIFHRESSKGADGYQVGSLRAVQRRCVVQNGTGLRGLLRPHA